MDAQIPTSPSAFESIPTTGCTLTAPGALERIIEVPNRMTLDAMNRRSNIYRALVANPAPLSA
jgi:hypothetical protein